jgi:hypothetical protein
MIPDVPVVNSSLEGYVTLGPAGVILNPTSIHRHRPFGDAMQQKIVQLHNSPNRERCRASMALSSQYRSRQVSSGKALSR